MLKSLAIALFICLESFGFAQNALDQAAVRNKQRVNYIYNFTDYITWSNLDTKKTFVIGVFGASELPLVEEFKNAAQKKNIKNLPVEIRHFVRIEDIEDVQILYVHKKEGLAIGALLPKLSLSNTLLVSENYVFRSSMINFMEFENEFHFDVNEANINRAGLLVSPQLLSFSIQQQKDWEMIFERLEEDAKRIEDQKSELKLLNEEIERQKQRLDAQLAQIKKQQLNMNAQDGNLSARNRDLQKQMDEIRKQRAQLDELQSKVKQQSDEAYRLTNTLDQQEDAIRARKKELVGQRFLISEQEDRILEQGESIKEQEAILDTQWEKLRSQGLLIYVFSAIFLIIAGLIFFAYREYRRKKRSEEEVRIQNEKLIALNESLDSFVYRVSHDLKAPVINVKNMISMLKEHRGNESEPFVDKILENLDLSSNRLETTITDLLELSKIDRVEEKREQIRIMDVVNAILPEFQSELNELNATVEQSYLDVGTYSSFAEMSSIFQNLLTNSVKYRRKNVNLKISITTKEKEGFTELVYSDNGIGIDLTQFEGKVFSMFQRFNTDNSIAGTGVGMYIIKRLVEKNLGTIHLESKPNKGLTYFITLPSKMPTYD